MKLPGITIAHSLGDTITDSNGQQYLDLCMGYGSISFGHNHPLIIERIKQQLDTTYSPGFLDTAAKTDAISAINSIIPDSHRAHATFSTGMESVEASLRLSTHVTKRKKLLAFQEAMHGKSLLTSALTNKDLTLAQHQTTSLPYIKKKSEADILDNVYHHLKTREYAALLIEPIQMSNNGIIPGNDFFKRLHELCEQHGTLMIFDEILSGFYRSGDCFFFQQLEFTPDIILTGKALGNGFPAAALILDKNIDTNALPYRMESTYSNHPLTCAAINASIAISKQVNLKTKVSEIENTILQSLKRDQLFGKGAMWCYKINSAHNTLKFYTELLAKGILVSFFDGYIRLLPSYFIDLDALHTACQTITAIDETLYQ